MRQRRNGFSVLGGGLGLGVLMSGFGLALAYGSLCIMCPSSEQRDRKMHAGVGLLIGGSVIAAASLLMGSAMAITGHVRMKRLKRAHLAGVSVAVTPSGAGVGWQYSF